jgi:hypothetical protein
VQPPPPSPALERALAGLRPIRTRRPARVLVGVAGASLAYAAAFVWKLGVRSDLARLPLMPFALHGAASLSTFLALLWCALVPPRGQVLASGTTSARVTALLLGALVGLDLAIAVHPLAGAALPATSLAAFLAAAARCLATSLGVVALPVALGLWSLRRLLLASGWRVLAALGGAAGALGGLVLHVHCAASDAAHVGLVHGAALLLPASILAVAAVARLSSPADQDMSDEVTRNGI